MNNAVLTDIVERASNFAERLGGTFDVGETDVDEQRVEALLAHWHQLIAPGDIEKFERRLDWDGLDLSVLRRALGRPKLKDGGLLPAWSATLNELIGAYERLTGDASASDRAFDPYEPLPFQEILQPCLLLARKKLLHNAHSIEAVSEEALIALDRALLHQISEIFRMPLFTEFNVQRAARQTGFSRLLAEATNPNADEEYKAFQEQMRSAQILPFFTKYPVLARLTSETIDRWVDSCTELLERLNNDRREIGNMFGSGQCPGDVVALGTGLSDSHDGGRSVVSVRFASGLRLIYKPRDLGVERTWFSLLAWLNAHCPPMQFRLLKVLERTGYGWVEFVDNSECGNLTEVEQYYERSGMMLCLAYALGGTDLHFENLVASGNQPVLIDLETIIHPELAEFRDNPFATDAHFLAQRRVQEGVLSTGLLPWWITNEDGATLDISGLGAFAEQMSVDRSMRWSSPGTDRMDLTYDYVEIPLSGNVVRLHGEAQSASDYIEFIIHGFEVMHAALVQHSDTLIGENGPLSVFADQTFRFLFRDTRVYGNLLMSTLDCTSLQDGALRSIELDILSKPLLEGGDVNRFWHLRQSEQAALERMDIPYFSAIGSDRNILLEKGGAITNGFREAPLERARSRLQSLEVDGTAAITKMIRTALHSRVAINGAHDASDDEDFGNGEVLSKDELLSHAAEISLALRDLSIQSSDGSASWIGLGYLPVSDRFQLQPTGPDLYSGYAGIALYLAAYAKMSGSDEFATLSLRALHSLRRELLNDGTIAELNSFLGIGGATGSGSLIYAMVRVGQFLGDDSLTSDALHIAEHLSIDALTHKTPLDIVSGTAGAIFGLLALYDATDERWLFERARAGGEYLLRSRIMSSSGHLTWQTRSIAQPLAGMSHGAAGISNALLRLSAYEDNRDFISAALEGIAYEKTLFDPNMGNWRDLRGSTPGDEGGYSYQTAWCHGAPGIALARLGGLAMVDTDDIRQEIDVALETTRRHGIGGFDHLCCGAMGRVDTMIEGACRLNRQDLLDAAHQQAASLVRRARRAGGYETQTGRGMTDPGFFSGISGIGYTLLRLSDPDALPSVLLWD